jgi:O-Antigen ligase
VIDETGGWGGGGRTIVIALPQLPFTGPEPERRRVEVGLGTLLVALGAIALLVLFFGTKTAALVVAGVIGLTVVLAAVLVPAVALTLLVVDDFANVSGVLVAHGLPGIHTPLLVVGIVSALVATRSSVYRERMGNIPLLPALLVVTYIVTVIPAAIASMDPTNTAIKMRENLVDLGFLVLVLVLARLVQKPWAIPMMIVIPLTVIAVMTVINQVALQDPESFWGFARISKASGELVTTPRYSGPMEDSNFWGRVLILGLPMALALSHRAIAAKRKLPAVTWGVSVLFLLGACYLTQSRGTLIAAGVASVVWLIAAGPSVRRRALLLLPFMAMLLLIPGVGNRLAGVSEAFDDAPAYLKDPSIVERGTAGHLAGQIFMDHPVLGTGPASFATVLDDYAARRPDTLIGVTTATHNLYLEILSETGVIGMAGWAVLMIGVAIMAVMATLRLAGAPRDGPDGAPTRALAAATVGALVSWSLASLFLHLTLVRTLWVVLALVGLLYTLTKGQYAPVGSGRLATARAVRGLRTGIGVTAVMIVAGGAVGAAILYNLREPVYTARSAYTLVPAAGTYYSYGLDIRSRQPVLPAYSAMIQGQQSRTVLKVDAEPATGLITFVGTGATEQEARGRVVAAAAAAPAALGRYGADKQYDLIEVSDPELTEDHTYPELAILLTAAAVLAELGFSLLILRLLRGQPVVPSQLARGRREHVGAR